MSFFTTSVTGLKIVVTAIGAGVGVWGVINPVSYTHLTLPTILRV